MDVKIYDKAPNLWKARLETLDKSMAVEYKPINYYNRSDLGVQILSAEMCRGFVGVNFKLNVFRRR